MPASLSYMTKSRGLLVKFPEVPGVTLRAQSYYPHRSDHSLVPGKFAAPAAGGVLMFINYGIQLWHHK